GGLGLEAAELFEQRPELGRGRHLVPQAGQRALLLRARGCAGRRHLRLFVPREQGQRAVEVGDSAETPQEFVELRGRRTDGQEASASTPSNRLLRMGWSRESNNSGSSCLSRTGFGGDRV